MLAEGLNDLSMTLDARHNCVNCPHSNSVLDHPVPFGFGMCHSLIHSLNMYPDNDLNMIHGVEHTQR